MWCVAELDAEYISHMEDVLALYEHPYDPKEPVVCLDEKPVSLHADVRPPRPARPGHVAKRDNEYQRCGTANIFGIVEPKAGQHFTCATSNRSAAQFAAMIRTVVTAYPRAGRSAMSRDTPDPHPRAAVVRNPAPGIVARTVGTPRSLGASPGKTPAKSLATNRLSSSGQRPSLGQG